MMNGMLLATVFVGAISVCMAVNVKTPGSAKMAANLSKKFLEYKNAPGGPVSIEYQTVKPQLEKTVQGLVDSGEIRLEECSVAPEDQTMAYCRVKVWQIPRRVVVTDQALVQKITQLAAENKDKPKPSFADKFKGIGEQFKNMGQKMTKAVSMEPSPASVAVDLSKKFIEYKNAPGGPVSIEYQTVKPQLEKTVQGLVDSGEIRLEECSVAPEDQTMAYCRVKVWQIPRRVVVTDQALVQKITQLAAENKDKPKPSFADKFKGIGEQFKNMGQKMGGMVSNMKKMMPSVNMKSLLPTPSPAQVAVDLSKKFLTYKNAPGGPDSVEYQTVKPQLEKTVQGLVDDESIVLEECNIAPEDQTMAYCKVKVWYGWGKVVVTDQALVKRISQVSGDKGRSKGSAFVTINGVKAEVEVDVVAGSKYFVNKAK